MNDLRQRTKQYALDVIGLFALLPQKTEYQIMGKQFLRSGTSVGAQYREACRAKSNADMISKFEGMLQELDETDYWLDLLFEITINHRTEISKLLKETDELIAIFTTSVKTIKSKKH